MFDFYLLTVLFVCFLLAVTDAGKVGDPLAQDFFKEEYMLNSAIGESVKFQEFFVVCRLPLTFEVSLLTFHPLFQVHIQSPMLPLLMELPWEE